MWKQERVKLNCNFRAVTVVRASNSPAVAVSVHARLPLPAKTKVEGVLIPFLNSEHLHLHSSEAKTH